MARLGIVEIRSRALWARQFAIFSLLVAMLAIKLGRTDCTRINPPLCGST